MKDFAEKYNEHSIIGAIHSHHHMNLKDFSQHDHDFVNSNHDLSVVVTVDTNGKIHMVGQIRVKTPCGALMPVPVQILQYYENFDEDVAIQIVDDSVDVLSYLGNIEGDIDLGLAPYTRRVISEAESKKSHGARPSKGPSLPRQPILE